MGNRRRITIKVVIAEAVAEAIIFSEDFSNSTFPAATWL